MDNKESVSGETLLVCVTPSLSSAKLVSSAKTLADRLHAKWYTVYVAEPNVLNLTNALFLSVIIHFTPCIE